MLAKHHKAGIIVFRYILVIVRLDNDNGKKINPASNGHCEISAFDWRRTRDLR